MEPGAVDEVGVTVVPPLHRTRVTVTFGRVIVQDAAALGGRLALCLAVGDQTARWPDDGAVDVEDGKVFELDRRFDLVVNPASVLWVAVTGDGAAGTPCGVVREPYLGLDDWGAGEHGYRSRLGHPDDPERPGPDAEQGPFTIEFAIEPTPLDA
jgi:hypothetical protein